jgi:hypothetical protein
LPSRSDIALRGVGSSSEVPADGEFAVHYLALTGGEVRAAGADIVVPKLMLISIRVVKAMQQRTVPMKRHCVDRFIVLAALIVGCLASPSADAQQSETHAQGTGTQDNLRQNFLIQHQ